MSSRPTIADLARAAKVSVSTVDRVINGRDPVRKPTAEKVLTAANALGFHAAGVIRHRLGSGRPTKTLGFLLLQKTRSLYQILGESLAEAARASTLVQATPKIVHVEDLDPAAVAGEIERLGRSVDAIAIVAANHPRVAAAVTALHEQGVPVFALISELTAPAAAGYVGLDNFKVGRTAGWAIANFCKRPGPVAIIVGSHRFRCQDLNEMGFRSYFREHAPDFSLLEPLSSLEDARYAAEVTRDLLARVPGLAALYVAGGGMSGVLAALRDNDAHRRIVTIGHDLTRHTQAGLIDGFLRLVIAHPVSEMTQALVAAMATAALAKDHGVPPSLVLPFYIHTSENV
jgi:LacI family transcriptional regulator